MAATETKLVDAEDSTAIRHMFYIVFPLSLHGWSAALESC